MGAKQGQKPGRGSKSAASSPSKSAGRQRLALIIFGAVFVVLFAGFAIAEGIGDPSVPSGDVALVESVPADVGHISKEEFNRALARSAAKFELKKAPRVGDDKYEEAKEAAMEELINEVWIRGEGEEMGIEVTPNQVETKLAEIKEQNFSAPGSFEKFLKESQYTPEEVDSRVALEIVVSKIQQQLAAAAAPATESEIEDYYDAAKSEQFTQPASRDIRAIVNKDEKKVEEAKAALEKDDSAKNWKVVAKKYSEDPFTKTTGGLQAGVTEESGRFPKEVEGAMFSAGLLKVEGPIKGTTGSYVFQVEKETQEKVQGLKEVKAQISAQLTQQKQQDELTKFTTGWQSKWTSRTFCADDFVIALCANYKASGPPASVDPGCYEADPKKARPADCPAPVQSTRPALPGTVSVLKPQGEQLAQRPRPEGLKEEEAGATTGLEGIVPGATEVPAE